MGGILGPVIRCYLLYMWGGFDRPGSIRCFLSSSYSLYFPTSKRNLMHLSWLWVLVLNLIIKIKSRCHDLGTVAPVNRNPLQNSFLTQVGYSEYTSICDDLIVLSVYGTAAVIKHLDPQHTTTEGQGKENHGENSRSQIRVQIVFLRSLPTHRLPRLFPTFSDT